MRSFREIRFRLRQELVNAWFLVRSDRLQNDLRLAATPCKLPDPETFLALVKDSPYSARIVELADSFCKHRFPLLGCEIETGPEIRWRRDYVRGIESGTKYFRRIPYLDVSRVGDHKIIWELNRHQHLIVLAQAWRLTGRQDFLDEIPRQIESWWAQNPYMRGINWASALEVALRVLSWIWVCHLCAGELPDEFRGRLAEGIFRHGAYLENNLSVYFSPNTHLLGEAVALHAIGVLFPMFPRAERWRSLGGKITAREMDRQVRGDGSHFEQSSAYHVYALDFFLVHALLEEVDKTYRDKLRLMADYLAALSSEDGFIPLLGDDDGGNLFHPHGSQRRYGARTLACCCAYFGSSEWPHETADLAYQAAWWMGERAYARTEAVSAHPGQAIYFRDAGVAVLSREPAHIVADTRAFGFGGAGHSHAHALSVVCRYRGRDILIDPGTYTYTAEPEWRTRFRGTAFHNTVEIDGLDQATGGGPFRWLDKPEGGALRWIPGRQGSYLHAACSYRGLRHERHLLWIPGGGALVAIDVVREASGEPGRERTVRQSWHCGQEVRECGPVFRIGDTAAIGFGGGNVRVVSGWQSETPGRKTARPAIVNESRVRLPAAMAAVVVFGREFRNGVEVETDAAGGRITVRAGEGRRVEAAGGCDPLVEWV